MTCYLSQLFQLISITTFGTDLSIFEGCIVHLWEIAAIFSNMKQILFLICFVAVSLVSSGQRVTVSQEFNLGNDLAYDILGEIDNNILLYRDRGREHLVEVYDEDMTKVKERKIEFEKRNIELHGIVAHDTSFNMLYSYQHKGEIIHMARRYDGHMVLQDSTELWREPKTFKSPRYLIETSENKRYSVLFAFESSRKMKLHVIRHDSLDNPLTKILEVEDLDLRDKFKSIVISDRAEVMVLMEERNSKFGKDKNGYILITMLPSEDFLYTSITTPEVVNTDIFFKLDNLNRRICLVGLWDNSDRSEATGYYYINKPLLTLSESETLTFVEFEDTFIAEANSKAIGKSSALENYILRDVILRGDGGFIFIMEKIKEYTRKSNYASGADGYRGLSRMSGWMDHFYDDIAAVALYPDGRQHWEQVFFKKQFSQDDAAIFSSYCLMLTPSRLKLIFNDEIKSNNTVSEYVIDPVGDYNRNSVLSTDYQNLKIRFADAVQVASNTIIAPSEKNRKLSLVKITF